MAEAMPLGSSTGIGLERALHIAPSEGADVSPFSRCSPGELGAGHAVPFVPPGSASLSTDVDLVVENRRPKVRE
jgi:hypothetical protein